MARKRAQSKSKRRSADATAVEPQRAAIAARPAPPTPPTPPTPALGARVLGLLSARWAMPAILSLALALRVVHLIALHGSPYFAHLDLDHRYYDEWGYRIAQGEAGDAGSYFVDPLYAYFLAANYALFGHSLLAPRLLQIALGVATCYFAARIARRVFESDAAANLAALCLALFLPAIYFDSALEKTTLSLFLLTAAVERFLNHEPRRLFAAGALLGLAVLTRGNLLLFLPAGVCWLALRAGRPWDLRRAAWFAAPAALVVLASAAHNYRASRELVLTSANFGQNLYIGQQRGNASGTYEGPAFVRPDPRYEQADFEAEATRRTGHELSPGECSSFWTAQALAEITAEPSLAVVRTFKKLFLFFHQFELPDSENLETIADYSPLLRVPLLGMGMLSTLALLGASAYARERERADVRCLLGIVVLYTASVCAFFVLARFRALIVPLLAVLAAGGLLRAPSLWRSTRPAWRYPALGGALGLVLLLTHRPQWLEEKRQSSLAIAYHNLATMLEEANDAEGALRAHERAIAVDDAAAVASLRQLGELYLKRGDYAQAERVMTRVLELKPDSKLARDALKRLYALMPGKQGEPAPAEPDENAAGGPTVDSAAAALYQKSRALRQAGRFDEAIAVLEQAIAVGAYDENARYLLGGLMESHATPDAMVSYWSSDVAIDPKPQTGYYYWAIGLKRGGLLAQAIDKLNQALAIDPAHELSELELCRILEQQDRPLDALVHCKNASEILPDLRAAHEETAKLLTRLGRTAEADQSRELAAHTDPKMSRQYYYWARYLAQHGRADAARRELARALAQNPSDSDALALQASLEPAQPAALSATERATLVARLQKDAGAPFWIAVYDRDPAARALGVALSAALSEAGWKDRGLSSVSFRPKPGLFVFAADETPPAYVDALTGALDASGLHPTVGRDYRAYYEEKRRARADYPGFPLAPEQSYVLVIGPRAGP